MKKVVVFILMCAVFSGCKSKSLEERLIDMARYIEANCRKTTMSKALPFRFTEALEISRDSAERFVARLESEVKMGRCPE